MKSKDVAIWRVAAIASFPLLAAPCGAQNTTEQGTGAHAPQNAPQASAPTSSDQNFVTKAIQANDQEIDRARAELNSTTDPNVKMFAQRMINDHTALPTRRSPHLPQGERL